MSRTDGARRAAARADNPGCHRDVLALITDGLSQGPAEHLRVVVDAERQLADARRALVVTLVADRGWTYGQVGRALGISRQGAVKQYGPIVDAELRQRIWDRWRQ